MSLSILTMQLSLEHDVVLVRQRARQVAKLLGFEAQDQTRIATAVSEIARNALNYGGGGRVEFEVNGKTAPQLMVICISDRGRGIANLDEILEGRYQSRTGMGLGIVGARRLMDQFHIESAPRAGTKVLLKKLLPVAASLVSQQRLSEISAELARLRPQDPLGEIQQQNQELLRTHTNRGVVALYAELDEKADHLRRADELKSRFLSNMSHEFRTPVNSIIAISHLLLARMDGDLTSEQEKQVRFISTAAHDLSTQPAAFDGFQAIPVCTESYCLGLILDVAHDDDGQFACRIVLLQPSQEAPRILTFELQIQHNHLRLLSMQHLMKGEDVLAQLKADSSTENIPVIIVTSKHLQPSERESLNEKAVAVLSKTVLSRPEGLPLLREALQRAGWDVFLQTARS